MATTGQLVENSLWFAFDALDHQKSGSVPKTQLKVLTQNIGVVLNIKRRVEDCIDDFRSFSQLTFEQFLYFLTREVFAEIDDGQKCYKDLKIYHDVLERAFWVLGCPNIVQRQRPALSEKSLYKIFRIFCLLGDRILHEGLLTQVTLSREEVQHVAKSLVLELGGEWEPLDFDKVVALIPSFTLPVFLTFLEGGYLQDTEQPALDIAVEEIYQTLIQQVFEKNKMYQKLSWGQVWIYREVEVVPWEIRPVRHYGQSNPLSKPIRLKSKNPNAFLQPIQDKVIQSHPSLQQIHKILKYRPALISLTPKCAVHNLTDEPGDRPCRITIYSENDVLHLAAPDYKTKTRWLRALHEAVKHSDDPLPYHKVLSKARKLDRSMKEEKESDEKNSRASQSDVLAQTKADLVAEKITREEVGEVARQEAIARSNEEKRVQELTRLERELGELWERETQAKRDEEIVRALQAKLIQEEWQKREELHHLQKEQNEILEGERRKREAFQAINEEKENQLKEAQKLLEKLEMERLRLDHEMRVAREKIVLSERGKEIVEARMRVTEHTRPPRAYSLHTIRREKTMPSTLRATSFNIDFTKVFRKQLGAKKEQEEEYHSDEEGILKSAKEKLEIRFHTLPNRMPNPFTRKTHRGREGQLSFKNNSHL